MNTSGWLQLALYVALLLLLAKPPTTWNHNMAMA